jgi:hypothetical protein
MSINKNENISVAEQSVGRRSLLGKAAAIAAGVAATSLLSSSKALAVSPALTFSNIPGTGDVKVLNFALALEDLEANLYAQALQRLTTGGTNALGTTIPGLNLSSSQPDVYYLVEFGKVEAEHRDFLRGALGSAAITPFKYNFNMQNLSRKQVADLVYTAESLGVSAYLGAIPYLTTKTYLQIAGAIQGTEARHTAVFAEVIDTLFSEGLQVAPVTKQYGYGVQMGIDYSTAPDIVLRTVSPYIVV